MAPQKAPWIRLTIDAEGNVTDAALQSSGGDPALDSAAVEAARKMAFTPAARLLPGKKDLEPFAVYLDVEVRYVEAPK